MKCTLMAVVTAVAAGAASADEGMWLFNQPPRQVLKERHQFEPGDAWFNRLQWASVRFNSGGSGSFVSEDGLLISNHHVAAGDLQKLSTPERDYLTDGFYARTLAEERQCLDLELNVLQSIEDVTAQVNAAVPRSAEADKAFEARRKVIAQIEKESLDKTGLRSDVVTLWKGGAYHLYRYKRYTDVRMVFAPEKQAAFFGGDPDNFEFPRYDLDVCFFRAYENGKPARVRDWLRFSPGGPRERDLVLVSGHPGGTSRLLTTEQLAQERDASLPFALQLLKQVEVRLASWSARSPENARRANDDLFSVQNSRKALDGMLAGLLDTGFMSVKKSEEASFKARLTGKPEHAEALAAYDRIAQAVKVQAANMRRLSLLEERQWLMGESFGIARALLRAAEERPKPNGERLEEYSDSARESLELGLFSRKPIYEDLETVKLAEALTLLAGEFGADNSLAQKALAGKAPAERAAELVQNTKVRDVAFRKRLYQGGAATVSAAADPMIEFARILDPESRALRKTAEAQGEIVKQAHAAISQARLAVLGTTGYPDATFTLRLAFGTVKGYEDNGSTVPAFTTLAGLYERSRQMGNRYPFELPASWAKRKSRLDLITPFNFLSTCDITGGNSGSPVVNRAGDFVGIIFDGNLQSLPWDYGYSDEKGRAIAVNSTAILHTLERVYSAKALARELLTGQRER